MDVTRLLSVIVTSYNNSLYLRACLNSIIQQTYRPIEIVVADDASTDDSTRILHEYETSFPGIVRTIYNKDNKGVAQNRHNAIVKACGKWIVTLDGDDAFLDERKLEQEMSLICFYKENHNQDIAAFSNVLLTDADNSPIALTGDATNIREGFILPQILGRSCMIPRDFVISRKIYFDIGGYDFGIPIYEDWDLKIRIAERIPFYYTGCVGTIYRRHGSGLSAAPASEHREWINRIFEKYSHRLPKTMLGTARSDLEKLMAKIQP